MFLTAHFEALLNSSVVSDILPGRSKLSDMQSLKKEILFDEESFMVTEQLSPGTFISEKSTNKDTLMSKSHI